MLRLKKSDLYNKYYWRNDYAKGGYSRMRNKRYLDKVIKEFDYELYDWDN